MIVTTSHIEISDEQNFPLAGCTCILVYHQTVNCMFFRTKKPMGLKTPRTLIYPASSILQKNQQIKEKTEAVFYRYKEIYINLQGVW